MWEFWRSSVEDGVILVLYGSPVRGRYVVKVNALPDRKVEICFDDGTTMELPLADYSNAGCFADKLRADMGALEFVHEFEHLLSPLSLVPPVQETERPSTSTESTTSAQLLNANAGGVTNGSDTIQPTPDSEAEIGGETQSPVKSTASATSTQTSDLKPGEAPAGADTKQQNPDGKGGGHWKRNLLMAALGAPLAVGAVMVALPAIGFTAGGIAAGSYAASMMSAAAVANGGGVAAGSAVAVLQSVGAAGLGAGGTAAVGGVGATVGGATSYLVGLFKDKFKKNKNEVNDATAAADDDDTNKN
ncbi:interferon alpha-inducible protein 27-like protein 2B isoform X1 [Acanthaster planci]|uniref:Interferon alpha-inducible protein 27-like protein 2B isoform X1 n=1 Tax=Acanthaster planci TaxID=133434 RepID=A0A8B7YPR2_ACAPL|nr:interferon alpha-inducible protein 27-like protein 2B isoform X1 [Acanthaster planci]